MTVSFCTYDYRGEWIVFDKWENVQLIPRKGDLITFYLYNKGKDETVNREVREVTWKDKNNVEILVNL